MTRLLSRWLRTAANMAGASRQNQGATDGYTSEDVHRALFEEAPGPQTLEDLKEGVRQYAKGRRAGLP